MRLGVDGSHVSRILTRDISTGAVREKCNGTWTPPRLDLCDHALRVSVNREHFAFFLARHVHFAICGVNADTFRLLRHLYLAANLPGAEVDDRDTRIVFVRYESELSVSADCELLGV